MLTAATPKHFLDSAHLEWDIKNIETVRSLLEEGLSCYPTEAKLWVALGQLNGEEHGEGAALQTYNTGLSVIPTSVSLQRACALELASTAAGQ
jgi:hypothetical protein